MRWVHRLASALYDGVMKGKTFGVLLAAAVLGCGSAAAHHSVAEKYRIDEHVTIEGELVTLIFRNPHSYLHVRAPDRAAHSRVWAVESGRGLQLRHALASATLKPGDRVIVTGDPGRDEGEWRMRLRTIVRPRDGWRWSEGAGARAAAPWGVTSARPQLDRAPGRMQ
jgi:hypothetical protein